MTDEETPPVKAMESVLLSVGHFWSLRETTDRQVDLIERHFHQDEMLAALRELAELTGLPPPKKRNPGAARSATKAQAEDVVATIKKLGDEDKLPRFQVQSDDLPRVLPLLGAVSVGDERGVAARLEALEAAQRASMDEMRRMVATVTRGAAHTVTVPEIAVTSPTFAAVVKTPVPTNVTTGGTGPGRAQEESRSQPARQWPGRTDRSVSRKRTREGEGAGEWREVTHQRGRKPRARPKAVTGTASLAEFDDLAGPEQFWIGNTRASTDEDKVKEVLQKCAESLKVESFTIENVFCLTKDTNPQTKSWKVSVPARFKELMGNPGMYPRGWSHRVFHSGPRRQEGASAQAAAAADTEAGTATV